MKRLLVLPLLLLIGLSLSALAASTVKSSKSNSSDRDTATAPAADETPGTIYNSESGFNAPSGANQPNAAKTTTANGSKSNNYRVQAPLFRANQPAGSPAAPGSTERQTAIHDAQRALVQQGRPTLDADQALPGSTPSPDPVGNSNLNSSRYNRVLTQQGRVSGMPVDPADAAQPVKQTQGRVQLDADRVMGGQQGQPGPAESSNLNSSRSNTFRTEKGSPGATPSPGPVGTIQLNSSRAGTYREMPSGPTTKAECDALKDAKAKQECNLRYSLNTNITSKVGTTDTAPIRAVPEGGPAGATTINNSKSSSFRRGTPESSPPKPTAAGAAPPDPAATPGKPTKDQKTGLHFEIN